MPNVVLIGTLDTKGEEYAWVRDRLRETGVGTTLIDVGVLSEPIVKSDVSREEVAHAAGSNLADLVSTSHRGNAMAIMANGAAATLTRLFEEGNVQGVLALGGSGGTAVATAAMRALPVGLPKIMVSTVASGDTRSYVGGSDICMMHSVVDIAGINQISTRILGNAAQAISAMAKGYKDSAGPFSGKPLIGASMFGVTTACVDVARSRLEELGYEVLVFHATGTGGQAMEALIASGLIQGVLDATTTELADELVGGVLSAGPDRLTAAGKHGVPQVVSLGALDMVNFGGRHTVPPQFEDRILLEHNPSVTLMRTTPDEAVELGRRIATRLNVAAGPTIVFIPRGGLSAVSEPGAPFHCPEADQALFESVVSNLNPHVTVVDQDVAINDPGFARSMAETLDRIIREQQEK